MSKVIPGVTGAVVGVALSMASQSAGAWSCPDPLPRMPHLEAQSCRSVQRGFVIRYVARVDLANEFDRRSVAIAFGDEPAEIAAVAGASNPRDPRVNATILIEPLYAEGLLRRVMRPRMRHGAWTIFTEEVYYPSRGMEIGYSMDCSTAVHFESGRSMAVAECYDVSNRSEFLASVADSEAAMARLTEQIRHQGVAASSAPKQTP